MKFAVSKQSLRGDITMENDAIIIKPPPLLPQSLRSKPCEHNV